MNFIRYPFFVVNLIFMVSGIIIMSIGILLLTNYSIVEHMLQMSAAKNSNYSENFYRTDVPVIFQASPAPRWLARIRDPASYLLITFGALYFTLSFIGCCGTIKDSRALMVIYAIFLAVIFIVEVVGVLIYWKYKPDLKAEVASALNSQYKPEEMGAFTQFEFIMDLLMINYKCCGVNNEKDFKEAYSHIYTVRSLPIDPRYRGDVKPANNLRRDASSTGEEEMHTLHENETMDTQDDVETDSTTTGIVSRVVTGEGEPLERKVPVSCCKLNITGVEAVKMLRNIYRKQEEKLQLLDFALDKACVTKPDETNSYVGDSHGCFDKIQGEISMPLRIGFIVVGLIQLCGLVFAAFVCKSAYYDW